MSKQRRLRRRVVISVAWLVGLVVVIALAGLPVYVYPPSDPADGVDAVLVLGPPTVVRTDRAREISKQNGGVPIVVSVSPSGEYSALGTQVCRSIDVECRTPEPFTTKGEAKLLGILADERGWTSVAVVTEAPHVMRARYIFDRCLAIETQVVSVPYTGPFFGVVHQYGYQTAAFLKAFSTKCA